MFPWPLEQLKRTLLSKVKFCALKLCGVPFWHATKFGRISCKRQLALQLIGHGLPSFCVAFVSDACIPMAPQRQATLRFHAEIAHAENKLCGQDLQSGNCRMSALKKPSPLHWSPFLLLLSPDMRPWRQLRGSSLLESLSVSAFSRLWPLHQKQVHLSDHCNVFLPDVTSIYTEFSEI